MGPAMNFQVVVLAGGLSKKLYPLVSKDVPKALLPLGNKPVLSYVLELLEASNLKEIILVVAGEDAAQCVGNWVADAVHDRLRVEVASVPEDSDTADALRSVMHRLTAEDFLVVSGDLVSDVPIGAVAAAHRRQGALVTALLCNRASLGSSEPGSEKIKREPVSDIIGLDSTQQHLLYVSPGPEIERDLRVRRSLLRAVGSMEIRTDLVDAHMYAFNRLIVQGVLESRPTIKSIKQDLVPYLVRSQLRLGVNSTAVGSPVEDKEDTHHHPSLPDTEVFYQLLRSSQSVNRVPASPLKCCTYIASKGKFCVRVNSLQAYLDMNREVAGEAIHLTGYEVSTHNNVIHETAQLGWKSTVGPQCMLGEGSTLGEKCSVKKSVVGRHCRIGSNVKIMNSVVMDYVTVEDGCTIQNSIICSNVNLQERCSLKDCQVGPGYVVGARLEVKGDALAKKEKA
ncbi:hypothetical protein M758_5G105800 [Ceratodon purpureus]|uniref:Translation initiation factor eIF2B subunit gamma n=1 Tax=Ceratodon purpureus TaxID=3225 RepID=A0A8T0I2W2_CERPU|nr:hypothetical protein KC19_5G123800 [Ceratodon purpureus]KAG0576993.1 hypothetical protein KC19_5G123800 [Ceratodon purpureus]KAG0616325.1 hypothetical protein M758_5G105800 [Ceratodon purpureus]KAG0616326.1 hypothetical protein M758_5G105800 [Ceratodon purpureus]